MTRKRNVRNMTVSMWKFSLEVKMVRIPLAVVGKKEPSKSLTPTSLSLKAITILNIITDP